MTYGAAKKLHNEDEVTRKSDGRVLTILNVEVTDKAVMMLCDDGETYRHTEVR